MLDALGPDARAAVAAAVLLALPGVTLVRSPWRAMPALSVAFWVLTWTWAWPVPRTRLLHAALAVLAVLAALRVARPGPLPRLRLAHAVLALVLVAAVLPLGSRAVAPGARMPAESVSAELLVWRDGWPASFEPLLPVRPFRASALATTAADVSLLSGAAPHRATVAAAVTATSLLLLGCWWLAAWRVESAVRAGPITAAAAVVLAWPPGSGPGMLAAALVVHAAVLWLDRRGMPSAVAAGACLAAALAADPATAAVLAVAAPVLAAPVRARVVEGPRRARVALVTAVVLALPLALRPPPLAAPEARAVIAVGLVVVLAAAWPATAPARRGRVGLTVATLVVALALAVALARAPDAFAAPTEGDLEAMAWIRDHAHPLDLVCAPDVPAARWIPAVAARPTVVPVASGWSAPEGACRIWLNLSGHDAPGHPSWAPSFRSDTAAVWTPSQRR